MILLMCLFSTSAISQEYKVADMAIIVKDMVTVMQVQEMSNNERVRFSMQYAEHVRSNMSARIIGTCRACDPDADLEFVKIMVDQCHCRGDKAYCKTFWTLKRDLIKKKKGDEPGDWPVCKK